MDVTYILQNIGVTDILLNYDVSIESPYFLLGITDPCGLSTKYAILASEGCNNNWRLAVEGVLEAYEELESGAIYFGESGTWEVDVYWQASSSNVNPDNATFLDTILFQIQFI